jgi:hypothetical protein
MRVTIISGTSRESVVRATDMAEAFSSLGHSVTVQDISTGVENHADLFLPTSDSHIELVGILNERFSLSGVSRKMGSILVSKSRTYQALQERGIDVPKWAIPSSVDEIGRLEFDNEIFVKPDRSSGSYSQSSWDYRRYDSTFDLINTVTPNRMQFDHRQTGESTFGPSIIQDWNSTPELRCVTAVMGDETFHVIAGQRVVLDHPKFGFHSAVFTPSCDPELIDILKVIHDMGVRRQIVYVQAMIADGKYQVIDLNVRFNLNLGMMISKFYPNIMTQIAACITDGRHLDPLPHPYYFLRTLYRENTHASLIEFTHPNIPANMLPIRMDPADLTGTTSRFDAQMSMPSFILYGNDPAALYDQANEFERLSTMRVE